MPLYPSFATVDDTSRRLTVRQKIRRLTISTARQYQLRLYGFEVHTKTNKVESFSFFP